MDIFGAEMMEPSKAGSEHRRPSSISEIDRHGRSEVSIAILDIQKTPQRCKDRFVCHNRKDVLLIDRMNGLARVRYV